jgi:hypothetical protein
MHIFISFYNPSTFLKLCVVASLPAYLHHKRVNFWLEKTRALQLHVIRDKQAYGKSRTLESAKVIGNWFSFIPMNWCPWTVVTFRSITVTAQGTHISEDLKHGLRFHHVFATGQKKKRPRYQLDLHRLVGCKADLTRYCHWLDSRPGRITFLAQTTCLEFKWFWIETWIV